MQKSTFSVNFFIRRTRLGKSGETPIMIRISVDGRYAELSTQRRVLVEQWSQSRCFATTITLANNVKLENVSKMLGHTNIRMTLHYAHIMNESLAQEMNKVAAIMGE